MKRDSVAIRGAAHHPEIAARAIDLERRDVVIVASVSAIYGLGDPQAYLSMVLHLVRGDRLDQRKLLRRLTDMRAS